MIFIHLDYGEKNIDMPLGKFDGRNKSSDKLLDKRAVVSAFD